jgi:peptidoglycan/LPS O-acetylase OafA/YrhL
VSFFFVLSGFVLAWSARPGDTVTGFWRRRLVKVWPNHAVTAVATLALLAAAGQLPSLFAVAANLTLTQAWIPAQPVYFGLNTPSWSLSCEALFYLCFPLLSPLVGRLSGRWLWPATLVAFAAIWAVPAVTQMLSTGLRYWVVFVCPPVRMIEFVAGILIARIVREGRWIRLGAVPAAILAAASYLVAGRVGGPYSYVAITVVALTLLIAAVAAADVAGRFTPLRSRLMVRLGELSFAFYLTHHLVIRVLTRRLGQHGWSIPAGIGVAILMLVGSLAAAWLLWRLVERPAMRFAKPSTKVRRSTELLGDATSRAQVIEEGASAG